MEEHWSVSVNVGANNILSIGENYLSGWDDVMDYADTVQGCAEHLLSFIGREAETTSELRAEVLRLTALCDGYRGERDTAKAETDRLLNQNRKVWAILNGAGLGMYTDEEANEQLRYYADVDARIDGMVSALTRTRAEAFEEAAEIASDTLYNTVNWGCDGDCNSPEVVAKAIRARAAKGEQ